jgi:hypothetical protein
MGLRFMFDPAQTTKEPIHTVIRGTPRRFLGLILKIMSIVVDLARFRYTRRMVMMCGMLDNLS